MCSQCISEEFYLVENVCVDCKLSENREICFRMLTRNFQIGGDFVLTIKLHFNYAFRELEVLSGSDLLVEYLNFQDLDYFREREIFVEGRTLIVRLQIRKSFVVPKLIGLRVPPQSRLRAVNRMRVNEFDDSTLNLTLLKLDKVLVPSLSEGDLKLGKTFNNIEEFINQENNLLLNIIKYSFVLRFFSNNQVIILASLLEARIPMNLHVSTQALSSGLKPLPEKYYAERAEEKERYEVMFGREVTPDEIEQTPPKLLKLYLSGYTRNILVNDPYFSQMFLVYAGALALLLAPALAVVL